MRSDDSGFSFIELLLALFIIAVVLLPLIALELQAEQQEDRAEVQVRALVAGREKMEELMATPYDDLADGNDTLALDGDRTLQRSWEVEFDAPRDGIATLTVTVQETVADGVGLGNAPATELTAAVREPLS